MTEITILALLAIVTTPGKSDMSHNPKGTVKFTVGQQVQKAIRYSIKYSDKIQEALYNSDRGPPSKFAIDGDAERGGEVELVLDELKHVHQEPLGGDHVALVVKGERRREHGVLDERRSVFGSF